MIGAPFLEDASAQRVSPYEARAACDLLARVRSRNPRRIADFRAGPFSPPALLAERFPGASIETIDASWVDTTLATGGKGEFDLIHASGDLELLPSLRRLLPNLVAQLKVGGLLAVQFPNNLYEPNRTLARMLAVDGPWAQTLLPIAKSRPFNASMDGLYELMSPICETVEIWETTYLYSLCGVDAIIDFMRPRSLAPFLTRLDATSTRDFLRRYRSELEGAYPAQPDGRVLVRFPRIFALASR
jgi:trans-aconitate 2-methyltransferase